MYIGFQSSLFKIVFIIDIFIVGCNAQKLSNDFVYMGPINYQLSLSNIELLDSLQHRTFMYFLSEVNPNNGLVKDRSASWSPASIAAIGFALPSYAVGIEHGWISREKAAQLTLTTLKFFLNSKQSSDTNSSGYKGFYYHFLKMNLGTREWNCELSTVDTGLLMMGIIFSRNYYNEINDVENEIRSISAKLLERLNWEFFKMPPKGKYANTISMGWTPEHGIHDMGWIGYNEALFLYILAAGTGMKNVESGYKTWLESYEWLTPYPNLSHAAFPPLFGHQFSQIFIDFRKIADSYMKEKGIDYFENSKRATYVQRLYAIDNPHQWVGYDSLCWGISASDGPTEKYNFDEKKFLGYAGRGTSGPDFNYFDDGTITPYASISSMPFAPEIVLPTIKSFMEKYSDKLWGPYGFYDAFNLTANWFDDQYIGIDQGPLLLMIENFRTGLVWKHVMIDSIIQEGLKKLGFENLN
jgi:hypothetical protein